MLIQCPKRLKSIYGTSGRVKRKKKKEWEKQKHKAVSSSRLKTIGK